MFKKLLTTFSLLNPQTKSTIYIRWINKTRTLIIAIFANVYIYQVHGSIPDLIISNILYFFWSWLWFLLGGIIIHYKKKTNIKNLFYPSFIALSISFILMPLIGHTLIWVMLFFFVVWVWSGLFYFWTTNYEGVFIKDEQRNFYSSILNAWYTTLKITTPLLVALFFFLQPYTSINWYTLLFVATWIIYLYGIWFIRTIPDHFVKQHSIAWIKEYFKRWKETLYSMTFFSWYWLDKWVWILFSILLIIVLKSEISIGIYEWVLNLVAVFIMIALWVNASKKQQDKIFLIASSIFALICFMVWRIPSFYTLVIYSVWMIIIEPILRSMRLADFFRYQDIINNNWSMHLWVVYSESLMSIWRIILLSVVLLISYYANIETIIARWMSIFSLCYFFLYWNVKILLPKLKK